MPVGEMVFYGILAFVAVGSAIGMLLSRNAIYAALFLVFNFATVAVIYLLLQAHFIALVQITVYAGSIMVLFLFVIMLLGAERLSGKEPLKGQRFYAIGLGAVLLIEAVVVILTQIGVVQVVPSAGVDFAPPAAIGNALFSQYALPVLVTSIILLAATVGTILLTRGDKTLQKKL